MTRTGGADAAAPHQDVEFRSGGATLRGWLYPGAPASAPGPGVVLAHGLSAVKEMFLDRYAQVLARAGCTALVYDHFGFGASDGEPRQCAAPSIQLQGYRDALSWLGRHPMVDPARLGAWGSSFSGGLVVALAATEPSLRCAVAQVPYLGGAGPQLPAGGLAAVTEALETGRADATVPATTATPDGVGVMYVDGAHDWFNRVAAERAPRWRNELRIEGLLEPFDPLAHLAGTRVPLLLVVAPDDRLTPPAPGMAVAATVPLIEVHEIGGGHFGAYEAGFDDSAGAAADWFRRHLAP